MEYVRAILQAIASDEAELAKIERDADLRE
jgi:hypothetical protein